MGRLRQSTEKIQELLDKVESGFEKKQDGNIYIVGIGDYDGTNLDSARSVQEVINELVNKLNEITTDD